MFLLRERADAGTDDPHVVTSASDLTQASACEWAFLRRLDAKLGRIPAIVEERDAMNKRTSALGDEHEARVLQQYRDDFGDGVVEIARPTSMSAEHLQDAADATLRAFEAAADVVFQATFWDGSFVGFADFIVRQPDGSYEVQDTKLARSPKITALLQLAAYGEKIAALGIAVSPVARLILGDGTQSEHRLADIAPVYRRRVARLHGIIAERLAAPEPLAWGDARYTACGRCDQCEQAVQLHRDVLLVGGLSTRQRARLIAAGIDTIDALAAASGPVSDMTEATFANLREQARLQLESERPTDAADSAGAIPGAPAVRVFAPEALAAIPEPDAGDIFFDFEGDPLYSEARSDGTAEWGLDYLFGLIEPDGTFLAFWAHSFAEEREALRDFLDYVRRRRVQHPNMHIYHYASYERTHLLSLAARHGVGESYIDELLRAHVLVDLYPIVRHSVRVGSRSYSIKKLEPLYMGDEHREGDVTNAGDSITEYAELSELRVAGEAGDPDAAAEAQRMLDSIADYNEYDCLSTLRLRDWLLGFARDAEVRPLSAAERDPLDIEPSALHDALKEFGGDALDPERTADQRALAIAAAAIDYHRREQKSFWWAHFSRLVEPLDDWADTRDCFVIDRATLDREWHREGKQRSDRRHIVVRGSWAPGSTVKAGAKPYALYEHPGPWFDDRGDPGARVAKAVTILEVFDDGRMLLEETLGKDIDRYDAMPVALTPESPPRPGTQVDAIEWWGQNIVDSLGGAGRSPDSDVSEIAAALPREPVLDLLRRVPPHTQRGALPRTGDNLADVTAAVLDLDDSYLAVQGPPGTGKTYLASHLIAELVRTHKWKIGVVSQSHAVVENVLDRVVTSAGLDASLVGKALKQGDDADHAFTAIDKKQYLTFGLDHAESGYVIGGTAWTFSNPAYVGRRDLDLLVVDEAGQYSLGSTIAASVAARNLVLLGDPQQLPQVSQGTHPEPVDESALGWVSAGHDVLPEELGYFLAESRRMREEVTAVVSDLSYEGELSSHTCAADRQLQNRSPGLHIDAVDHTGNATSSPEEAARVVEIVRDYLGGRWTDPDSGRDGEPLTEHDIIVVSPYNAQVGVVREALDAAGHSAVRVGTVDKFQGQEAVIAIVSLAASDPTEVPRGMGFLLMKNRLNVSISRAQWAAHLVFSPSLIDYLPHTPEELAQLSAFIRLVDGR
ncbi:TM0106 family RecB-like putative nuclease [Paramicrobacterium fandaimingii]|uniref:TM0106 family RecB-like putative nuclease n=1 Tax=Paramicrobacterium fandaimingii TaxID=2708079 RepID=UPI00141FE1D9|nr:bifunctional RecB family nuclease/DEAD/DEAH box helicase [Microbacterium fandaimingii]